MSCSHTHTASEGLAVHDVPLTPEGRLRLCNTNEDGWPVIADAETVRMPKNRLARSALGSVTGPAIGY